MGGSFRAVEECQTTDCDLHPFRMGTNPRQTGKKMGGRRTSKLVGREKMVNG
jgi:hypothetical protein